MDGGNNANESMDLFCCRAVGSETEQMGRDTIGEDQDCCEGGLKGGVEDYW